MAWPKSEEERQREFPVTQNAIFLAHAGVSPLPARAARAMADYAMEASERQQEFAEVWRLVAAARQAAASAIGAHPHEIALLGPTSLGLSLFAHGLDWRDGEEVVYYPDDYPSNVYPWTDLARRGVRAVPLEPEQPGRITPEVVRRALTPRTRLVALASCHYLTGWRVDLPAMAEMLRPRGILLALDAIQTVGAFPTPASAVDFLSADSHKWMLGPMAAGIVFVAERHFERLRPCLLGAWNVHSPDFLAQERLEFEPGARRYEPGVLNIVGIAGMKAALDVLEEAGAREVSARLLAVRDALEERLESLGFEFLSPPASEPLRSGILTARHPRADTRALFERLEAARISASLRRSRDGRWWLRFSPHFYNTQAEIEQAARVLKDALEKDFL